MRDSNLIAQPFDAQRLELSGEPLVLAGHVDADDDYNTSDFSVSGNGVLAWRTGQNGCDYLTLVLGENLHDVTIRLVVDDEVMIRNVARITLEADGHFILTAHDGEEALHISRIFPGTIHAVLSDVKMRPRVRTSDDKEVRLGSYEMFHRGEPLTETVWEKLTTRWLKAVLCGFADHSHLTHLLRRLTTWPSNGVNYPVGRFLWVPLTGQSLLIFRVC